MGGESKEDAGCPHPTSRVRNKLPNRALVEFRVERPRPETQESKV